MENILAAYKIGDYFKVSHENIKKGIEKYQPDNSRSQLMKTERNQLILDAYNANPSSMMVSIENFYSVKSAYQKILILGDMLELGDLSQKYHQEIIDLINQNSFKQVYLVGEIFSKCDSDFEIFLNSNELKQQLDKIKLQNKLILIKGSRGIELENIIKSL